MAQETETGALYQPIGVGTSKRKGYMYTYD